MSRYANATAGSGIAYDTGFDVQPPIIDVRLFANSGVATGDYDGDGDIDLFIVRGDIGPNLLYRNDGRLVFRDVATSAGLAYTRSATRNYRHAGPAFADVDGDGDLDLFMGGLDGDPSMLFRNNLRETGIATFTDVTPGSGIDALGAEYTLSAAFGDYDLDGDLDLAVAHWGTERDFDFPGDTEHLWRNDTDGSGIRFTSASLEAAISPSVLTLPDPNVLTSREGLAFDRTFTPTFARINEDPYPDLLMVADFNRSQVFINSGDGTFVNATDVNVIIDDNGMGSAVGDYDNDGDLDWFVSSIYEDEDGGKVGNRLYRNHMGAFEDVSGAAGIEDGGWGWAVCALDLDNDGDLDIYHTNGWHDEPDADTNYENDRSRAFVNSGDGTFVEQARELGIDDAEFGRGVVCADLDNDGDVDILQLHDTATLWENRTPDTGDNNYLRVKLHGLPPNTEAAGARIAVTIGTATQLREIMVGNNFLSQNPTVQIFGLGTSTAADIDIEWPDGEETTAANVSHGQTMEFFHPRARRPAGLGTVP